MSESIYVVGDLQGCLESFDELLDQLPTDARFVFVGDIVNRGPASLSTLRRVKALDEAGRCKAVLLGNHDLHLLAVAAGAGKLHSSDTIAEILDAPDRKELLSLKMRGFTPERFPKLCKVKTGSSICRVCTATIRTQRIQGLPACGRF